MSRRKLWAAATALAVASAGIAMPALAAPTGGSGGPLEDRLNVPFTSNGLTSDYHIYADGLDWSKSVGLLMYGDGSGGFGIDNPSSSYLLGGSSGLAAVAQEHNLLLVVPEAPTPGCDGIDNCWYNSTAAAKAKWSSDLMTHIKSQYSIDTDRIVVGGYSSGAQWQRWFLPRYAEAQSVDLAVMIAYGGAPAVSANYSAGYKDDLTLVWNTGTNDSAYTSASYGAIGGYNWYTDAGFTTEATWPAGVGHGRSGEFGGIMDAAITKYLPAATASTPTPEPEPTPTPGPTPAPTPEPEPTDPAPPMPVTVNATEAGVTLTADVPDAQAEATYFRLSNPTTGRTTYLYNTGARPAAVTFRTLGTLGDEWNYAIYAGPSTNQAPLASGTFRTWTQPPPQSIPGDLNGDRVVNFDDLKALSDSRPDDTELADIAANWGSN